MATTIATDYVIWMKHIHGDPDLVAEIANMAPGDGITLRVEGQEGAWVRMDAGRDGRPTLGIKPIGRSRQHWRSLYKHSRGAAVTIERAQTTEGFSEMSRPAFDQKAAIGRVLRSDADRSAALAALLDGAAQGWRSNGEVFTRDELHER